MLNELSELSSFVSCYMWIRKLTGTCITFICFDPVGYLTTTNLAARDWASRRLFAEFSEERVFARPTYRGIRRHTAFNGHILGSPRLAGCSLKGLELNSCWPCAWLTFRSVSVNWGQNCCITSSCYSVYLCQKLAYVLIWKLEYFGFITMLIMSRLRWVSEFLWRILARVKAAATSNIQEKHMWSLPFVYFLICVQENSKKTC